MVKLRARSSATGSDVVGGLLSLENLMDDECAAMAPEDFRAIIPLDILLQARPAIVTST